MAFTEMQYGSANAQFNHGNVTTTSSTSTYTIKCGFKPKYIGVVFQGASGTESTNANGCCRIIYDEDYSTGYSYIGARGNSGTEVTATMSVTGSPTGANLFINNITSSGFDLKYTNTGASLYGTLYWFAVG